MGIDDYIGIGKPEEKSTIEVRINPVQAVANAYLTWQKYEGMDNKQRLDEAEHMLASLDSILPETLGEEYCIAREKQAGIFYSALLNMGNQKRRLHVPLQNINYLGYGIRKGTLEIYEHAMRVGVKACGGCIVCHKHVLSLGDGSTNTVFVAHKGVFYTEGRDNTFISHTQRPMYILLGNKYFSFVDDSTHIVMPQCFRTLRKDMFTQVGAVLGSWAPKWLRKEVKLHRLTEKVRLITLKKADEDKIRAIVKSIEDIYRK